VSDNPWHRLPTTPPYFLSEDRERVEALNANFPEHHRCRLDLDIIPEPFVGRPDAPVVILGNNPGIKSPQTAEYRRRPAFIERMRNNLLHRLDDDYPFFFLDPNDLVMPPDGRKWWERKLDGLFRAFGPDKEDKEVARAILAKSILAVEFFPYASRRYGHGRDPLPSQQYSFGLVRSAMARGASIVLTRGHKRWLGAMKDLEGYSKLVWLKQVQSAPVSKNNCRDPKQFEEMVRAIRAALP
jgi:hypothetical protein